MSNTLPSEQDLLGNSETVKRFLSRLKARRREHASLRFDTRSESRSQVPDGVKAYRKGDAPHEAFVARSKPAKSKNSNGNSNSSSSSSSKSNNSKSSNSQSGQKNNKPVPLQAAADVARAIVRPGQPCECEASLHTLVNNCNGCGRIICEQEAGDYW